MKTCAISGDIDGVERFLEQFRLHAEHLQEVDWNKFMCNSFLKVCRLLHHISLTDALHVFTGHAERNLRALAPLVRKMKTREINYQFLLLRLYWPVESFVCILHRGLPVKIWKFSVILGQQM